MKEVKFLRENIKEKLKESIIAVLPISAIVALLCFSITPVSTDVFIMFVVGAVMLVIGMALFNLGAETSMNVIGERIGVYISGRKKFFVSFILLILIGVIVAAAEPDLLVFAEQICEIPTLLTICMVAVGSGILLALAYFRAIFGIKLKYVLMVLYGIVFALAIFTPKEFWAIAFDSGGVATGAISVPFIVALGAGAARLRSDKDAENDSFRTSCYLLCWSGNCDDDFGTFL